MQSGAMLAAAVVVVLMVVGVNSHGMMMLPVQRSSMFRDPRFPNAPPNYNDNQLFCGGTQKQWGQNGGKCGICGDAYDDPAPRPNEAGGTYANGIIVETYEPGTVIDVTIRITANHLGYFLFKLCPNNDVTREATQACLDQYVLKVQAADGTATERFYTDSSTGDKHLRVQLPPGLTCSQCVLQWTYHTGNSWGCDAPGSCCVGCGPQENFVNCADIAITSFGNDPNPNTQAPTAAPTTTTTTASQPTSSATTTTTTSTVITTERPTTSSTTTTTTKRPTTSSTTTTTTPQPSGGSSGCVGVAPYDAVPGMDNWCVVNCAAGYCPPSHCNCS